MIDCRDEKWNELWVNILLIICNKLSLRKVKYILCIIFIVHCWAEFVDCSSTIWWTLNMLGSIYMSFYRESKVLNAVGYVTERAMWTSRYLCLFVFYMWDGHWQSLQSDEPHDLPSSVINIKVSLVTSSHSGAGHFSPWARGGRRYHPREPHFNGTMLFRNMNGNYFCLLDIPNSQLKPANLHISTIVHIPHAPSPPPPGMYETFYFVPGICLNMKSGYHHHQIWMDYLWDAIFKIAAIKISRITFSTKTQFLR